MRRGLSPSRGRGGGKQFGEEGIFLLSGWGNGGAIVPRQRIIPPTVGATGYTTRDVHGDKLQLFIIWGRKERFPN